MIGGGVGRDANVRPEAHNQRAGAGRSRARPDGGILAFACIVCCLSSCSECHFTAAPGVANAASSALLAEFEVEGDPDSILVPVSLGGKVVYCLLSTGSSSVAFDISLREELGEKKRTALSQIGGTVARITRHDPPAATLAGLDLRSGGLVDCIDMAHDTAIEGRPVSGIVGMSFLREYVLQLDFDGGKVRIIAPAETHHDEWGTSVPIRYGPMGRPRVVVHLDSGIAKDFIIDTGLGITGAIAWEVWNELRGSSLVRATASTADLVYGPERVLSHNMARVGHIAVGGFTHKDVIFGIDPEPDVSSGMDPVLSESYLGLPFLSRYLVTLDFPGGLMYLKPGKQYDRRDEADMSGMRIMRSGGVTSVFAVMKDGTAAEAGVRPGDVILEIDGKKAVDLELWTIRSLLGSEDGRLIKMTIRRGDEEIEVSFRLKRRL
jgi:hypothetical protein